MNSEPVDEKAAYNVARRIETPEAQADYLEQVCGDNPDVMQRVVELLRVHDEEQSFLEAPPLAFGADATLDQPITERPGTTIDRYKLLEQIGEGGFGVVFMAEQQEPVRRKVALKIIKPGMDTKEVIARFEAERQALALMDHPNIAKVFDAGTTGEFVVPASAGSSAADGEDRLKPGRRTGRPYFAMELVRGIPITEYCDQANLTPRERLELFISVCHAVQHAHQKGIIHRDIKPTNVMVTLHDDTPVVKVIDFGVAKAIAQRLTEKTLFTRFSQMVGTPLYMSPEQTHISGLDVDTRSDIYSLGVLLYELLTGTTPFEKERFRDAAYDELLKIIREEEPPKPSARISTLEHTATTVSAHRRSDPKKLSALVCGELDWIVMKAMEKDRTRRYETASSLAADVQRYLDDEPVEACPPSVAYRFRKYARRNKTVLASASLVAAALVFGMVGTAWQAVRADAERVVATTQRDHAVEAEKLAQKSEQAAKRERNAAVIAREELRRVLYASELNRAQSAWEAGSYRRVMQILESTRPKPGESDLRGFEWHYWNRRLHGPLETQVIDMPRVGTNRILDNTLSPDGSTLAVQYHDQHEVSVAIWDVATRKETLHFQLDRGMLNLPRKLPMFFSPDGTRLAILDTQRGLEDSFISLYRKLEIWNTQTGKRLFQMEDDANIRRVFFSHDGNRVVVSFVIFEKGRRDTHGYKVWDLNSDQITFSHRFEDVVSAGVVFLSPDGKKIGVYWQRLLGRSDLRILDVETAKVLNERTSTSYLHCDAISFDGARLLVRIESLPNQALILDSQSLETISTLSVDKDYLEEVLFSPDGRLLAASTRASKVGSTRASKVLIWNLDDAPQAPEKAIPPLFTLRVPSPAEHLRFSGDSKQLRCCILRRIWTWNIPDRLAAGKPRSWSNGAILGGSFNRDGTRAVLRAEPAAGFNDPRSSATSDSAPQQAFAVLAWDVEADREIWRRQAPDDRAFAMPVLGPDSRYVVVPSENRRLSPGEGRPGVFSTQLHVLDGHTGHEIRVFRPTGASDIDNMVFTPDGRHVAVLVTRRPKDDDLDWSQIPASFQVVLWNVVTGEEVFAVKIDDDHPNLCGFTPDGKELMVGLQASRGLLVLDAATGASRRIIAPKGTALQESGKWSLSPDRKTLALVGSQDHSQDITVTLFAAKTGALLRRIPVDTRFSPLGICWSPDSRRIALVSEHYMRNAVFNNRLAGKVTIWDVDTGRLLLALNREGLATGHSRAIRFSPDNHRLLHIAADNRFERGKTYSYLHPIHIWDATPLPTTPRNH